MKKKLFKELVFLSIGCVLFSLYVSVLLVPNKIGTGGITGVCIALNHLFNFPIGLTTIILNIPLFIFGYNILGKNFAIKSGIIVITSSLLIDFLKLHFYFKPLGDMLTSTIFCGVVSGIAMALLFMSGASTGGFDISGKIIKNKFPSLQLAKILLIQDVFVYIFIAMSLGPRSVMYAIIMSFIRSKTIDTFQEYIASSKQCIIICENSDLITEQIKYKLGRGVTRLNAEGCYSHTNKKFLYVVIQKIQLNELKSIVNTIEPTSFLTISSVNDIQGNFKQKSYSI
ncbi:YitT family protein [Clostridium aestuarii]|uniref:YitT family protein n=1 Tax=Clostridium aestuarii TaxID=338193 RepID=A0ABT4CZZ6_9CLOT|nr:YitT family protein [Clostridium aestuarii]MCY6484554.1 YitT family protein [Clostridium aestuarii]